MENLEIRLQKASDAVEGLEPEIDRLRHKLARVEDYVSYDLEQALKKSGDSINTGLHDATNLQQLLAVAIQTILDGTSHVAAVQESSVQLAKQNEEGMDRWSASMATAAATVMALGNQIVRVSAQVWPPLLTNDRTIPGVIASRPTGAICASTNLSGRLRSPRLSSR